MKKTKFMQVYEKQQSVHPPPQAASKENQSLCKFTESNSRFTHRRRRRVKKTKVYANLRKATAAPPTAAGGE
ncbi:MAG: hypothetical protein RR115_07505 [Hydrogenoanaerobacterium sp.]